MRRAFVNALIDLADRDDRVVLLTGDLGFEVFDEFKSRFGPRYVNVGIAESEMVCVAAGLAREGFRPFAYSIASFMSIAYVLTAVCLAVYLFFAILLFRKTRQLPSRAFPNKLLFILYVVILFVIQIGRAHV